MEFTIARNEMLAGLYLTQGIVERRTTVPILGNVLVQSHGNGISIAATDQEITVCRECVATVKRKGTLTTGARKLYEMVREFPEGDVKIKSLDNNWIEVSAGRSRFRLVGLDPREFPVIPQPSEAAPSGTLRLPGSVLSEMIEHTIFAVSGDETRTNLNGLFLQSTEQGQLRMVATDGHRLAMITRKIEGADLARGVIIPRKAVLELRKVLESGDDVIDIIIEAGVVHAKRGAVQMSMRLTEGEFPDYRQVVPSKSERIAVIDTAGLLAALRRVSIVSSERTRGVKMEINSQRLELSSINPDVGEAAEEMEIEYDGEALAIGFNARYVIEVLSILPADSRVEFGFNDDVSPGVLRQSGDPDYCYIVMPMRL